MVNMNSVEHCVHVERRRCVHVYGTQTSAAKTSLGFHLFKKRRQHKSNIYICFCVFGKYFVRLYEKVLSVVALGNRSEVDLTS